MLKIKFGHSDDALKKAPLYFDTVFEREWFDNDLVKQMVTDIDKSTVIGGGVIDSPVLGLITPRELSGGVKRLILMLFEPENVYDITNMGDNCGEWLIKLGKLHDLEVVVNRPFKFLPPERKEEGGLGMLCLNSGNHMDNMDDFMTEYFNWRSAV